MYFLIFVVKFILYPIPYIYVGMQRFIKFLAHQSIFGMKFNGPFKYMTASESGGCFWENSSHPQISHDFESIHMLCFRLPVTFMIDHRISYISIFTVFAM